MGLVEWWRRLQRTWAEQAAVRQHRKEVKAFEVVDAWWHTEAATLNSELRIARNPAELTQHLDGTIPIILHKHEQPRLVAHGVALVEPKRLPGEWIGGYSGFSFRIMRGVRYHVGGTRGHYVPGPEVPTPIDVGTATITNQRVVFQATKHAREWAYPKLLGYQHDPNRPITYFQVSNRQKVSGIQYDPQFARVWQFRLALALAEFQGQLPDLVAQVEAAIADHGEIRPSPPRALAPPPPDAA